MVTCENCEYYNECLLNGIDLGYPISCHGYTPIIQAEGRKEGKSMVKYNFVVSLSSTLTSTINSINKYGDKIIAITQDHDLYTIFFEEGGNLEVNQNE